jgi:hypothetical protein
MPRFSDEPISTNRLSIPSEMDSPLASAYVIVARIEDIPSAPAIR